MTTKIYLELEDYTPSIWYVYPDGSIAVYNKWIGYCDRPDSSIEKLKRHIDYILNDGGMVSIQKINESKEDVIKSYDIIID